MQLFQIRKKLKIWSTLVPGIWNTVHSTCTPTSNYFTTRSLSPILLATTGKSCNIFHYTLTYIYIHTIQYIYIYVCVHIYLYTYWKSTGVVYCTRDLSLWYNSFCKRTVFSTDSFFWRGAEWVHTKGWIFRWMEQLLNLETHKVMDGVILGKWKESINSSTVLSRRQRCSLKMLLGGIKVWSRNILENSPPSDSSSISIRK